MTLAAWYTHRYGGRWRTARKPRRCDRSLVGGYRCNTWTQPGEKYFEVELTSPNARHQFDKMKLCAECANTEGF